MDICGLEIYSHQEPGYRPQVDFGSWRVALLNSMPMYLPDGLTYFDKHLLTDEVFLLLFGSCWLLVAGQGDKPNRSKAVRLEAHKVYNVRQNTWHTLIMAPGSKLAVVENCDTGLANSPRYYFTEEEKKILIPPVSIQNDGA